MLSTKMLDLNVDLPSGEREPSAAPELNLTAAGTEEFKKKRRRTRKKKHPKATAEGDQVETGVDDAVHLQAHLTGSASEEEAKSETMKDEVVKDEVSNDNLLKQLEETSVATVDKTPSAPDFLPNVNGSSHKNIDNQAAHIEKLKRQLKARQDELTSVGNQLSIAKALLYLHNEKGVAATIKRVSEHGIQGLQREDRPVDSSETPKKKRRVRGGHNWKQKQQLLHLFLFVYCVSQKMQEEEKSAAQDPLETALVLYRPLQSPTQEDRRQLSANPVQEATVFNLQSWALKLGDWKQPTTNLFTANSEAVAISLNQGSEVPLALSGDNLAASSDNALVLYNAGSSATRREGSITHQLPVTFEGEMESDSMALVVYEEPTTSLPAVSTVPADNSIAVFLPMRLVTESTVETLRIPYLLEETKQTLSPSNPLARYCSRRSTPQLLFLLALVFIAGFFTGTLNAKFPESTVSFNVDKIEESLTIIDNTSPFNASEPEAVAILPTPTATKHNAVLAAEYLTGFHDIFEALETDGPSDGEAFGGEEEEPVEAKSVWRDRRIVVPAVAAGVVVVGVALFQLCW